MTFAPSLFDRFASSLPMALAASLCLLLLAAAPVGTAWAQNHEVSGRVTAAEDDSPVPGANVVVKGTTVGTATDADGTYSLNAPSAQDTLVVSFVGFEAQEVPIDGRSNIDVALGADADELDELVVVGYGTQGRAEVTSAIATVSAEEISQAPALSPDEALQGRVAGVQVTNSGAPGDSPIVRIRGLNTVNNNDPLYVVDGVPMGGLLGIDPSNIASVDVLKDASAASIYGSRAAGGVVLITTKRGQEGAPQVSFNSRVGVQRPWKQLDLLNTDQYIEFNTAIQEAADEAVPPRFDEDDLRSTSIDYQDEVFRTAPVMSHDLTVSGGTEAVQYLVSGGYAQEEGTVINSGFERYSFRVNTDIQLGPVKLGESLALSYRDEKNVRAAGGREIFEHTTKFPPYLQPYNEDNLGGFNGPDQIDNNDAQNPVRVQEIGTNVNSETKIIGNLSAEVELLDGLSLRSLLGVDAAFNNNKDVTPAFEAGLTGQNFATISEGRGSFFSPLSTTTLTFDRAFGSHDVELLGGFEWQSFNGEGLSGSGQNPLTNDITVPGSVDEDDVGGSENTDVLLSYFTRANYNYAGRYLLQAAIRRDGYSRFGPNNKWGVFPSVSAGWNAARESFLEDAEWLSTLKLRGSYGVTGNNNALGRYEYQPTVSTNYTYFFPGGPATGATIPGLAIEDLRWETTTMTNVGVDLGLWGGALTLSTEYYRNVTEDVLLSVPLAGSLGYDSSPRLNSGEIESRGFEFTAGYAHQGSGDFGWSVDANLSTVDNEVLSLGQGNPINGPEWQGDPLTRVTEGQPVYYFYGWQVDRLFQQDDFDAEGTLRDGLATQENLTAPGDIKFQDLNGDGVINDEDRTNLGSPIPTFTFGLSGSANWRSFDLNMTLQGGGGNKIYRAYAYWTEGMTRVFNAETTVLDRWTPENTDTDVPRGITGDPNRNARASDRFLEDGDYLRLKLLTLGYTVPSTFSWMRQARIYVQAQNLLTFTGYSGYDPEIGAVSGTGGRSTNNAFGVDYGQYPQPRMYSVGVQLGF